MKKLLLFVLAAFAFAACEQAPIEEQSAVRQDSPDTITVGFEGDDTRIQLNEAQKTVWTKDDQVSVFYRSNANQLWQYDGETGARTATLKRVNAGTASRDMDRVVVVYPYNEDYYINPSTYNIQASLPATQHYLDGSYGLDGNIMISSAEYNDVTLKNVCGWLKLQLTGDGEVVKSITFKGNNGEQVAGELYINSAEATAILASDMGNVTEDDGDNATGGVGANLSFDDVVLKEVTLDCGEGVALGKNATAFYIALPPQTFEKGLTVEIEDVDSYIMKQSTNNIVSIERNHIQPMAALEFINPNRPTQPNQPIPSSNEIWYTATEKADPYFDDFLTFGSNVDSNVWDSETKRGIITFDGDVTMIGDDAFNNCDKFTSITLPESVTSIGKQAFYDCDGLTEFTIPDSVTDVGANAFYTCGQLASVTIGDSVTTIGNYAFYSCDSLTSVTIGDSVTTIGNLAFAYCDSLTSVNIPDSVTTIGNQAFYSCTRLTSVTIGDSVTTIGAAAFSNCESLTEFNGKFASEDGRCLIVDGTLNSFAPAGLTSYTIPDSVTEIGNYTFRDCYSLTSVNIPESVTEIGNFAFYNCTSLTSVTIPDSVTSIGHDAFQYCTSLTSVTIGDSVKTIGNFAFESCTSLTSVTIGDSVTTIGEYAFAHCSSLKKVYCYATVPPTLLEDNSFGHVFSGNASGRRIYVYEECVELYKSAWSSYKDSIYTNGQNCPDTTTIEYTTNDGNIVTPKNMLVVSNIYENGVGTLVVVGKIAYIPNNAFENCTSLTSVNIPDSVTTIGGYAFYGCGSLTGVTIGDSVTTIGEWAFAYCDSLTSVTIPDSVKTIGNYAFRYCTSLTSVTIPDSVTSIGHDAFQYCTSLTSVTIGDSVKTIGNFAFESCTSLTSVTIGDSVTTIGEYAFSSCHSLTSVYCECTTPPTGGSYMFDSNASGRKIYVPAESVDAYKSATNWSVYASAIVGYDFDKGEVVE